MTGPGWSLWGWHLQHAQNATGYAAPYMADSRIKHVLGMPNKHMFVMSYTDGGNTCLRQHPADINTPLGELMGVDNQQTGGGGGGKSGWVFEITGRGAVERAAVFRGEITTAAWDEWGRMLVGGQGVFRPGDSDLGGQHDGAGLVMLNREWTSILFKSHIGKERDGAQGNAQTWAITIDSKSGLAAACGWVSGTMPGSNQQAVQDTSGKDAWLAVFRLWSPDAYAAAKAAEKEAAKRDS